MGNYRFVSKRHSVNLSSKANLDIMSGFVYARVKIATDKVIQSEFISLPASDSRELERRFSTTLLRDGKGKNLKSMQISFLNLANPIPRLNYAISFFAMFFFRFIWSENCSTAVNLFSIIFINLFSPSHITSIPFNPIERSLFFSMWICVL